MNVTKTATTNFVKELVFLEVEVCVVAVVIIFVFKCNSKYPNRVPVARGTLNVLFAVVPVSNWEFVCCLGIINEGNED